MNNAEETITQPVNFQGYSVLIIDDNPTNLGVITDHLDAYGFKTLVARNGEVGLQRAKLAQPDIILLDVLMPGIDGFETCRRLKADNVTSAIPVIFMTALNNTADKVKGFEVGGVDYVTKPIEHAEALARISTHLRIRDLTRSLQTQTEMLQETNQELTQTLENLKATQKQLVEAEKMAALGSLVAGIAHEINNPIGIGVTTASTLRDGTVAFTEAFQNGRLKRSALEAYLQLSQKSSQLILTNLQRAAELVQSFKQVAVDQTYLERRQFLVKRYLDEVLLSLAPQLKQTKHILEVEGDEQLKMNSYPGALSHVVTALVMNSILHAYPDDQSGYLNVRLIPQGHNVIIEYADDGCGIPEEHIEEIFHPFFTTTRGQGGSGLGLHIVYNLVTQKLKGSIRCESQVDLGTKFTLELPVQC